jgi:hypothetical protein
MIKSVTRGYLPGVKRQGREADHSLPSSGEVRIRGAIRPLPNTPSWFGALLIKAQGQLYIIVICYQVVVPERYRREEESAEIF